jgi:hypothetical protein
MNRLRTGPGAPLQARAVQVPDQQSSWAGATGFAEVPPILLGSVG